MSKPGMGENLRESFNFEEVGVEFVKDDDSLWYQKVVMDKNNYCNKYV